MPGQTPQSGPGLRHQSPAAQTSSTLWTIPARSLAVALGMVIGSWHVLCLRSRLKQIEEAIESMRRLNESHATASVSPVLLNRGTHAQESVSSTLSEDSESDSEAGPRSDRPSIAQFLANPDMYLKPQRS